MHIKLDLKISVFLLLFIIMKKIEIYSMLMIFGLIHEIGHLMSGLILGMKPEKILILPYGFCLNYKINFIDYNKKIKNGTLLSAKKIAIYTAGPLINFLIAILIISSKNIIELKEFTRLEIFYCNIFIALFNLIPIYPMDGGKIVFELLHIFSGLKNSYKRIQDITWITLILLTITSSILVLYYKNIAIFITIIYLWTIVLRTQEYIKIKEKILFLGTLEKNINVTKM